MPGAVLSVSPLVSAHSSPSPHFTTEGPELPLGHASLCCCPRDLLDGAKLNTLSSVNGVSIEETLS